MKHVLSPVLAFTVVFSAGLAHAQQPHRRWIRYFTGEWTYGWKSSEGDFAEKGQLKITPTAKGNAYRAEVTTSTGDRESEIGGWQADREVWLLVGFSSNGGHWHVEYDEITKDSMSGSGYGKLPDGRSWKGEMKVVRKTEDEYEIHFDGTAGGDKLVATSVTTRKLSVPIKAQNALQRFVGNWKSETSMNGETIGSSTDNRRWSLGRHSVFMTSNGTEGGASRTGSGISGWDAKNKQIVEKWHSSDGLSVEVRYPFSGMKPGEWKGDFTVTFGDGKAYDGTCTIDFDADSWVWIAKWKQDGKDMVRKSVTRRLK